LLETNGSVYAAPKQKPAFRVYRVYR